MSCSIIDGIFAACCGIMYGMADMFGRTYEYVNVVLFCYVEPVLTVLMILGALYALFRLPKAKHEANAFMWTGIVVSALTGVLLIVSAIHAWGMVAMQNCKKQVFDQQFSEKLDSADFGKLVLHIVIDKAVMRQRAAASLLGA